MSPILASIIEFDIRPEGWIHCVQAGLDVPRGPIGVLVYLAFVPLFWLVPTRWRSRFLTVSSLLLALMTVGHAFAVTLAVLSLAGFAIVRSLSHPRRYWYGVTLLVGSYAVLIVYPQPPWLPPVEQSLHFYVHWAGIGYMFLKTLHVLNDRCRARLSPPPLWDWLGYILFAPTLRMGPIYRYGEFAEQIQGDLARDRRLGQAAWRIVSGLFRLGLLGVLVDHFNPDVLFLDPASLSPWRFVISIYLAPFSFFLWFSGCTELAIGVGRAMGFTVPENFNYPWFAVNIAEFWRRWHITLGAWLRDYIFNPLVRRRWHFFWAFTITFLLCGLWHANNWCYVIWGTSQGVGLAVMRMWTQYWKRQRSANTPLHRRLKAARLIDTWVSTALAWLLTFHFEIVTLMIGVDIHHAGKRVALHAAELLGSLIP